MDFGGRVTKSAKTEGNLTPASSSIIDSIGIVGALLELSHTLIVLALQVEDDGWEGLSENSQGRKLPYSLIQGYWVQRNGKSS